MSDLTLAKLNTPEMRNLMRTMPFTADDLDANDEGFLSARQIVELKAKTDLYVALSSLAAFMSFCVATILFYLANDLATLWALKILALAVFGAAVLCLVQSLAAGRRVRLGLGVETVEGAADLIVERSFDSNGKKEIIVYYLQVRDLRFQLTKEAYLSFTRGEYRVYYYRLLTKTLLSAEKIG